MKDLQKTSNGTKGGLFVGKSHAKGGIPAIVVDTGQPIEVEGGEVIINKVASKKYWKELSKINQSAGNGVAIPPPMGFSKEVSAFKKGGQITMSALKKGTEMEMEHSDTIKSFVKDGVTIKDVARKIAKDHLTENPNYYKILSKLKLAKGGEIICRSCGWDWHEQNAGTDKYVCHDCNSDNSAYYKKGGLTANMSKKEIEEFYETPAGRKLDAETYKEWKSLVNMSKSELEEFYNSEEGKEAGLSSLKAKELGISNGRTSARWIMKMKDIPFVNWNTDMWIWAKKQISFIKRMSGNKGSLYDENGNKTRKHTSLLIWGHNPEKYKLGGQTQRQKNKIGVVMHEFKEGELNSSSGRKVTNPKQAIAIALSEAGVSKYAKGTKLSSKDKGGNCYEVAGKIAMNDKLPKLPKEFNMLQFQGTPYVVHAEVLGQGAISGLRYGHAWVEDDLFVYDFSNGREITLPKQLYYQWGDVKLIAPKYYKYTFKEAIDKMLQTGHYGSWDLKTQSGL